MNEGTENVSSGVGRQLTGLKSLLHRLEDHRTHTSFDPQNSSKMPGGPESPVIIPYWERGRDFLVKLASTTNHIYELWVRLRNTASMNK